MKNEALKDKILEALKSGKIIEFHWKAATITVQNKTIFCKDDKGRPITTEVAHYIPCKNKHHIINNADMWLPIGLLIDCTLVSYECIRRLTDLKSTRQVIKYLLSGKIAVIDTTLDSYKKYKLSRIAPECIQNNTELTRKCQPALGYSLVARFEERALGYSLVARFEERSNNWVWHKPGNCLFKFNNKYFICGQDEGSYFGCELPSPAKTVESAIKLLAPKELRTKLNDPGIKRQGEWFFEPVELPKNVRWTIGDTGFHLPVEKGGNLHVVAAQTMAIDDKGYIYLRRFNVEHDEHATLSSGNDKWYRVLKNTAVRSVSVEGVD